MVNVLLATLLAIVAVAVVAYLLSLLLGAIGWRTSVSVDGLRLRRGRNKVRRGDALLRNGDAIGALVAFDAAYLPHAVRSSRAAREVERHHTGLLSRFMAVADQARGERLHLIALTKVDRLLARRAVLQEKLLTAWRGGVANPREVRREFDAVSKELGGAIRALAKEVVAMTQQAVH